jgi:hypothetical protein
MGVISGLEHGLALQPERLRGAEMHGRRGHETERSVVMLIAIPLFKLSHPGLSVP